MALNEKGEALCLELGDRSNLAYCYRNWGLLAREQRIARRSRKSWLPPLIFSPS